MHIIINKTYWFKIKGNYRIIKNIINKQVKNKKNKRIKLICGVKKKFEANQSQDQPNTALLLEKFY